MEETDETWRPRVRPLFAAILLIAFIASVIGLLAGTGLQPERLQRLEGQSVALVAGALVLLTLLLAWGLARLFPTRVGPGGVCSYNFWGLYRTLAWPEIHAVGHLRIPGLPYLLLRDEHGGTLYVPRFLVDPDQFRSRVRELAGEDHPLSRALEE